MWDDRIDPWRLKASASARGKQLHPGSSSAPITPSFPAISPPFHVSPPFQPSRSFPVTHSRHPHVRSSPSFPSPSPPSRRDHPVIFAPFCPPPHVHLQHPPSFPASLTRTSTQPSRPSLHPRLPSPADARSVFVPQELHRRYEAAPESTKTKALQTVIEMKVRLKEEKGPAHTLDTLFPGRMPKSARWSAA